MGGPNRRTGVTRYVIILLLAAVCPRAVSAQPVVRSISMVADLTAGDGTADVQVEMVLVPDGSAGLRLELLGFGDAVVESFRLLPDGPELHFDASSGSRAWTVIAPADFERSGITRVAVGEGGAAVRVNARYIVRNAVLHEGAAIHARVPVLTPALAPARESGDAFHAVVRLPPDWSLTESFPTRAVRRTDGEYDVTLAVAPAMLGIRARTDGVWRPGVPLVLDILAGVILLIFVAVGWRHLRAAAGDPRVGEAQP